MFFLVGYVVDENVNVNKVLEPFGVQYGTALVKPAAGFAWAVTHWADHPVSDGITQVGVQGAYEVKGGGTVVAQVDADLGLGEPITMLRAVEGDKGKVLVWGDEWITFDSEWAGHPDYQVERLWANSLKWLTPVTECQVPVPVLL